jgi:hypothetical protein
LRKRGDLCRKGKKKGTWKWNGKICATGDKIKAKS